MGGERDVHELDLILNGTTRRAHRGRLKPEPPMQPHFILDEILL